MRKASLGRFIAELGRLNKPVTETTAVADGGLFSGAPMLRLLRVPKVPVQRDRGRHHGYCSGCGGTVSGDKVCRRRSCRLFGVRA